MSNSSAEVVRAMFKDWLEKHPSSTEFYDDELPFKDSPLYGTALKFEEQAERAKAIMTEALVGNHFTPDLITNGIANKEWLPVFLFGREKKGFPAHAVLEQGDAIFVTDGFSMMKFCEMYLPTDGRQQPVVIATQNRGARIAGELYLVKRKTLMELDYMYQNGVKCKRVSQMFWAVNHSKPDKPVYQGFQAWTYMSRPADIEARVKKGLYRLVPMLTRKKPLPKETKTVYFSFLKKELVDEYKQNKSDGRNGTAPDESGEGLALAM